MENYIGQIQAFGFYYAPSGWATCDGQTLAVSQNTALFALLGTNYGGNGTTSFMLPDLRGRTMLHQGSGSGLSPRSIGQSSGSEQVTLLQPNLPPHTHTLMALSGAGTTSAPGGNVLAAASGSTDDDKPVTVTVYAPAGATIPMAQSSIGATGSSAPVGTMPPFLVVNVCIALQGLFPPRS